MDRPFQTQRLAGVDQAFGDGSPRQPAELLDRLRDRLARLEMNHPSAAPRPPGPDSGAYDYPQAEEIELNAVGAEPQSVFELTEDIESGEVAQPGHDVEPVEQNRIERSEQGVGWPQDEDLLRLSAEPWRNIGYGIFGDRNLGSNDPYRPWFAADEPGTPWFAQ